MSRIRHLGLALALVLAFAVPAAAQAPSPDAEPSALEVALLGRYFTRNLEYEDDLYGFLRSHQLTGAGGVGLRVRAYPGAFARRDGFASALGLQLYVERSFRAESSRADGESFPTEVSAVSLDLRGRLFLGQHEVAGVVGVGRHQLDIETSGPAQAGVTNVPDVPQVDYRFVRVGADARLWLGERLSATLAFAGLVVWDAGGIGGDLWFPHHDVGGVELGAGFRVSLPHELEIELGVDVRRYFFDFHPAIDDPYIVGGALDQHVTVTLGLGYRY